MAAERATEHASEHPNERLVALDAFRGFAIASMVLVNNPGDWGHLYRQLAHAEWNGWTFTDWIFPFFLFACGVAMTLSLERRRAHSERATRSALLWPLLRRLRSSSRSGSRSISSPRSIRPLCAFRVCCSGSGCASPLRRR